MRIEKQAIFKEITDRLNGADFTIVLAYGGLTVAELTELRKAILPLGGRCLVAKNALVARAAQDLGWQDISSMLSGPTAVVTAQGDAAELAKAVVKFVKAHAKAAVKGGALEKAALSAADVENLSNLPSKDVMRAQLLATFMAPATNLVRVFIAPVQQVLNVLQAKVDKEGGDAAPAEA